MVSGETPAASATAATVVPGVAAPLEQPTGGFEDAAAGLFGLGGAQR